MRSPVLCLARRTRRPALGLALLPGLLAPPAVAAEGPAGVQVVLQEVEDNRFSKGPLEGGLVVTLNLRGPGAQTAGAARPIVKAARDDRGTTLLVEPAKVPDFAERNVNGGRLDVRLKGPERAARTVSLSGAVEVFDPSRDPGAVVRVENALGKKDKRLSSKGLKAAKVEVTLLSKARYEAEQKKEDLDGARLAEIRAEGKRRSMTDKEIDDLVALAKAFREMGGPVPEDAVILSIPSAQNEKILSVRLVDAAGKELSVPMSESSSGGKTTTRVLRPEKTPPPDAGLVFTLLTEKSRTEVPFDLKAVPLP